MPNKSPKIVSLAAALAALTHGASSVATSAEAKADRGGVSDHESDAVRSHGTALNRLITTGDDLLGFIVTDLPDGTVVAQHYSHASHASHASHYSSR
jgi:hypothetical protein